MTYPKANPQKRTLSLKTRIIRPKSLKGVPFGSISGMVFSLDKDIPGSGHWLLDQVPEGATLMDLIKSLIIDFYDEQHPLIEEEKLLWAALSKS